MEKIAVRWVREPLLYRAGMILGEVMYEDYNNNTLEYLRANYMTNTIHKVKTSMDLDFMKELEEIPDEHGKTMGRSELCKKVSRKKTEWF